MQGFEKSALRGKPSDSSSAVHPGDAASSRGGVDAYCWVVPSAVIKRIAMSKEDLTPAR
jgi:hypothetical protein